MTIEMTPRRWIGVCSALLALALLGLLNVGPDNLGMLETLRAVTDVEHRWHTLIFDLRLPRMLLAALLGAALALAGTVTQGLFRNPLADPSVIGVSMGAALGAVIALTLSLDRLGLWITPIAGAGGAIATLFLLLAVTRGSGNVLTLLLAGVALSALFASVITIMLSLHLEHWEIGIKVMSYLMGDFEGRSWAHVLWALPPLVGGAMLALWLRHDLDLLLLGEETAHSLGTDLDKTRHGAIIAVGLLVGAATALVGVIGFLSLIVPHICRMAVGARHRWLMPGSALLGALFLVLVDSLARGPLPVAPGAICSLAGAPFLLWLLRRTERAMTLGEAS